jgi:hypothetical protein
MRTFLRLALTSALTLALVPSLADCSAGATKEGSSLLPDGAQAGDDATSGDDGSTSDDTGWVLGDSNGQTDTAIDPDAACAAQSYDGVRIPPNILLVFDQSGSMSDCADPSQFSCPGADKWASATTAVQQLLAAAPPDINIGIKFFGTVNDSCSDADYARPDVAIGPLSTTQKPIDCWLGKGTCPGITAASPQTLTEMAPAMRGGIAYLKSLKADGQRIAILITDGDPTNCDATNQISDVITAAANGYNGTPKVITYAIGVPGSTIANLSQVAAAGGGKRIPTCTANTSNASQACHYQIGTSNVQADLLKALNDITGKSLTCVFKVPASTADGGMADPNQVNVNLTVGGTTTTLGRDTTHQNGWDYTDGGSTITLYGQPCQTVLSNGTAKVDILLGCPTKGPQ